MDTKAIINTDVEGYNKYIEQRDRLKTQREEMAQMRQDINEIKEVLFKLFERMETKD